MRSRAAAVWASAVFTAVLLAGTVEPSAEAPAEKTSADEITGTLLEYSAEKEYVIVSQDGRPVRFRILPGKAEKAAPLIGKKVRVVFEKLSDPSLHALEISPAADSPGTNPSAAADAPAHEEK